MLTAVVLVTVVGEMVVVLWRGLCVVYIRRKLRVCCVGVRLSSSSLLLLLLLYIIFLSPTSTITPISSSSSSPSSPPFSSLPSPVIPPYSSDEGKDITKGKGRMDLIMCN